jgi:hypothetical protein
MGHEVTVFQNYYTPSQRKWLDPAFVPHDGTRNPYPDLFEIYWLTKLYGKGLHRASTYTGLVSWKFFLKTRILGHEFLQHIQQNPGHNVYFINPFPEHAYAYFNVWDHGEKAHPGITALAQTLFDKVGYKVSLRDLWRNDHRTLLFCNYWVGDGVFWETYMSFLDPILKVATRGGLSPRRNPYFASTNHSGRIRPFFPFIFERMFSTFLLTNPQISTCPYVFELEGILDRCIFEKPRGHVRQYYELIDCMDRQHKQRREGLHAFRNAFESAAIECGRWVRRSSNRRPAHYSYAEQN